MALSERRGTRRGGLLVRSPRPSQVLDEARRAEGRARIAREALPLFLRYGYHGTPVRLIAQAAGISVGSIFSYFEGKEAILLYILEENHAQAERAVELAQRELDARPARGGDRAAVFLSVYRRYVEAIDSVRRYTLLAYQETKSLATEQRKALFDRDRRILALLKQAAEPAVAAGIFSPEALDLKLASLMHLAQAWAIRRWFLSQYSTVEDYWEELKIIALGIMRSSGEVAEPADAKARPS